MGEYASVTGLFLSLIIFYFGLKHQRDNILFAAFHFTFSLVFYIEFQFLLGKSPLAVAFATMFYPWTQFLVGPLSFLYVVAFTTSRKAIRRQYVWHLIPVTLLFCSTLPYLLSSWTNKLESAEVIIRQGNIVKLNALFTNNQILWLKIIHNIGYLTACIVLMVRYFRKLRREGRLDFGDITQRWILFYAGAGTLLALLNTILLMLRIGYENRHEFQTKSFLLLTVPLIVFLAYNILLLFFPQILYGILKLKTPDMMAEETFTPASGDEKKGKINSELKVFTEDYITEIQQKLSEYIDQRLYCDRECSIGHLTSFSGIPAHHLSHYFNQILKERFPDWRNRLRINYSITLMRDGSARELKLDEIARQCGYNVRSTFIDAFRKVTGTTPGEYLKEISHPKS